MTESFDLYGLKQSCVIQVRGHKKGNFETT